MIYIILSIILLIVCSITDLKIRRIYTIFCLVMASMGIGSHFILGDEKYQDLLLGIVIGFIFLIISFIFKESIGRGDALVIIALGCSLGGKQVFQITFLAFVMTTVFALIGAISKKIKLKSEVPFIPFLFMSEIVILVLERAKI